MHPNAHEFRGLSVSCFGYLIENFEFRVDFPENALAVASFKGLYVAFINRFVEVQVSMCPVDTNVLVIIHPRVNRGLDDLSLNALISKRSPDLIDKFGDNPLWPQWRGQVEEFGKALPTVASDVLAGNFDIYKRPVRPVDDRQGKP